MRNIIRTSHDQRRRSSIAPCDLSPGGSNLDALRRGSISALVAATHMSVAETGSRRYSGNEGLGLVPERRQSDGTSPSSETRRQGIGSGLSCSSADPRRHSLAPAHCSPYIRRRSGDHRPKHHGRLERRGTFSEIKNRNIVAMIAFILTCCAAVFVMSYFVKEWLSRSDWALMLFMIW